MAEPFSGDVKFWLDEQGRGQCNLPQVLHKGPADPGEVFWGYGGSGPQDLALSVLAAFLPGDDVCLFGGQTCSRLANGLHSFFLEDFVAGLPKEGGVISGADIRAWIQAECERRDIRPVPTIPVG